MAAGWKIRITAFDIREVQTAKVMAIQWLEGLRPAGNLFRRGSFPSVFIAFLLTAPNWAARPGRRWTTERRKQRSGFCVLVFTRSCLIAIRIASWPGWLAALSARAQTASVQTAIKGRQCHVGAGHRRNVIQRQSIVLSTVLLSLIVKKFLRTASA